MEVPAVTKKLMLPHPPQHRFWLRNIILDWRLIHEKEKMDGNSIGSSD